MNINKFLWRLATWLVVATLAACGGSTEESDDFSDAQSHEAALALRSTKNSVTLKSDTGDYIGAGRSYSYTQSNAVLTVSSTGGLLTLNVGGNERWNSNFQLPNGASRLKVGTYRNAQRYPFNPVNRPGMDWGGEGRGCNTLTGWFTVEAVNYSRGVLTAVDISFEQHCEGAKPALHGHIHWNVADTTAPTGPVLPVPANLWVPAAGATPTSGNYVYLTSGAGDYIGQGLSYTYTQANAQLLVTATDGHLSVGVGGNENWSGNFQAMTGVTQLRPGYYGNLQRYPFHNAVFGGLDFSGQGRGCNTLQGWFVVDSVAYSNGALAAIDLRFEQHCEGAVPALRGKIHWVAGDTTTPSGPVNPAPAGLWAPAADATPASGNYVYLSSESGDYIGQGQTYTYTQANSTLTFTATAGLLSVGVSGSTWWNGNFKAMDSLQQLQPGYYGNLQRYPFHNTIFGGLDWSGSGRGCNTLQGWFVIDNVVYANGALSAIDLRFEQHCEGGAPALRGKVHWAAGDTTAPPGPVTPPPAGLWEPVAGATPASGNYIYLNSEPGDYIGQGQTYVYTPSNATVSVTGNGSLLNVNTSDSSTWWSGSFQAMNTIQQLQPGYYGNLQRFPFHNPTTGGLDWSGTGRGCNTLQGWFVIDNISYVNGNLSAVDLRFEQHCEGFTPALRGKIHWVL
jgi:hypothetical protein